jgi:hypothetical protein
MLRFGLEKNCIKSVHMHRLLPFFADVRNVERQNVEIQNVERQNVELQIVDLKLQNQHLI